MLKLESYRSAVFDCDGVILDSNNLKTEAFRSALAGESPGLVDEFIEYHQTHGGISRYVKFDYFFRVLKKSPAHAKEAGHALGLYAEICHSRLLECSLIPGVNEALRYFSSRGTECYVISGGDQAEVQSVLSARGLTQYFAGIFGSPRNKMKHLGDLTNAGLAMPGIYFGDAESDCETAKAHCLDFAFIAGRSEWRGGVAACQESGYPVYQDFAQLMGSFSQKGK